MKILEIILLLFFVNLCHGGLFTWLFKAKTKEKQPIVISSDTAFGNTNEDAGVVTEVVLAAKIPFEIKSSDEKFLMEAAAYTSLKLSELDVCHHKVILGLQTSCAELTEEDLSKVAVNLLNCQSVAEGRPIYPCTSDMTISDCTKDMDPNTWNAYHIVSNRARAVCYASRQEQFGAKTQMAVNMLMHTAEEQIKSMDDLQESQEALGIATSKTFDSLSDGHKHLQQQQQQLSTAHHAIHSFVSSNLRELSREKKLIASGQRELALITETIKRKLDEAHQQLMIQENSQKDAHSTILEDLSKIQDNALEVWQKLDTSTQKILSAHEETVHQYGRLTDDLQRMNATVHHLMDVLHSTRRGVEDKLSWITSLVGGTDNTVQKVYSCVLHISYFFIGMISASFLQVPYLTRVALVVLVPLNALAEVKHDTSLDFSTLTTILGFCVLVNLSCSFLWSIYHWQKKQKKLKNGGIHQPVTYKPSTTTFSPIFTQLFKTKPVERSPVKQHNTSVDVSPIQLNSTVVNANVPKTEPTCDYSSDEEPPSALPLPDMSVLRRRIMRRASIFNSSSKLHGDEVLESKVTNLQSSATNLLSCSESTDKVASSVQHHLLDQVHRPASSLMHHNLSLDGKVLASSSPVKEPPASSSVTSSRTMTPRKLCSSLCKNGQLCRNFALGENLFCYRHEGNSREGTPFYSRGSREVTPLYGRRLREGTPVYGKGSREGTPVYGKGSREGTPVYGKGSREGTPVYGKGSQEGTPLYGKGSREGTPLYGKGSREGTPVCGKGS
ncbi:protein brambleberry-like isoform X2 [Homarus americanus]|uniref:protein brambleberry-like isoform X2 n=1 Tax=Homarus americanus TaxID=6706 RepID=UPI001C465C5F|nr:protein brambleberry-like isoform X2 [Homarus americanus]